MVEIINGVRTTGNIAQERRVVDMAEDIVKLDPSEAPFLTLLKQSGMGKRKVFNPEFKWLENRPVPYVVVTSASGAASATSLTVEDASAIPVHTVLQNSATGENMRVTAVNTGSNSLTVVRGYGSTAAAAIESGARLTTLGVAMPENSSAPQPISTVEDTQYNYTQIFRTTIALSGTEAASKLYGGKDRNYQRREALVDHKKAIVRAMYLGQRKEDHSGSTTLRTMGGLKELLASAGHKAFEQSTAPLTWDSFVSSVAEPAFLHGSSEKVLLTGSNLVKHILSWGIEKVQLTVKENKFGLDIKTLLTPFGSLLVVHDRMLDTIGHSTHAFILDSSEMKYVHLSGRDTQLRLNIQADDVDGVMDEYLTECSLELHCPERHFHVTGIY